MSNPQTSPARRVRVEPGIYKRVDAAGKERLEITYLDSDGRQRWQTLPERSTITAARNERADVRARKGRGEKVRPNPRLRFGDAADKWWDGQAVKLRSATQSAYGASLKRLRARWDRARLDEITPANVADYITAMEGDGLKGWTLRGDMTVLGRVFDYATRHLGWAGTNPARGLDRSERPKSDERAKRILSAAETDRLIDAVYLMDREAAERASGDDWRPGYALLFEFAARTGTRLGETLGVRWHGLDLERGTVHISHQLDRAGQYVELKTRRSRRTVELPASLVAKLRAYKLASPHSGDHDYVFGTRTGSGHDHRNIGGRVLARAVKRAGLDAQERDGEVVNPAPVFHSLRHSHGSALIAAGWDIEEVSARLGHSDTGITHRTYIHAYESAQRSAARAERLEAMSYGKDVEKVNGREAQETAGSGAEVVPFQARQAADGNA